MMNQVSQTATLSAMNKLSCVLAVALMLVIWTANIDNALGQGLADTFTGFSTSSDEPIDIEADNLEVNDQLNTATFRGNVRVIQGDMTLATSVLKIEYSDGVDGGNQDITRMEASGNVVVNSAGNSLSGDWANFEMADDLIIFGGNVVVSQGQNVLRGERLLINLADNTTHLESSSESSNTRVQGSFMPKEDGDAPAGPSPESGQTN